MNLAPGVDITLFNIIFTRSICAVGIPTLPVLVMQLSSFTSCVLCISAFSVHTVHSNFPYVTSLKQLSGTCSLVMKWHVLVGSMIRFPAPWNRRPSLLAVHVIQVLCVCGSGWLVSCLCFIILLDLMSITARAAANITAGYLQLSRYCALPFLSSM